MLKKQIKIGLIGGTGFYEFFEGKTKEVQVRTKFGLPSDNIIIGKLFEKEVVFLPRHGRKHQLPPHRIPYQANIAAMKKLGVERIIAPTAVGSLKKNIGPGDEISGLSVSIRERDDLIQIWNTNSRLSTESNVIQHVKKLLTGVQFYTVFYTG